MVYAWNGRHGKVKPFSYVLYALMYPIVALDTRLRLVWRERKPAARELNRDLARWMLSRRVLTEDNLIMRAQKTLRGTRAGYTAANPYKWRRGRRCQRGPLWPSRRGLIN